MRKVMLAAGAIIAALALIIAIIIVYAAIKLNSIVASNRAALLARASAAIGRNVDVERIHVSLGWGVALSLDDLRIAEDPAFGQLPFVTARQVLCRVELLPLLGRHLVVSRLVLLNPEIRIVRNQAGVLNVSTLGKPAAVTAPPSPPAAPTTPQGGTGTVSPLQSAPVPSGREHSQALPVTVANLTVSDGNLIYQDAAAATPVRIAHTDITIDNLSETTPFAVDVHLAALGDRQNVTLHGTVGPLARDAKIDTAAVPFDLSLSLGPISLAQVRSVAALQAAIPARLSVSEPVTATIEAKGSPARVDFRAVSDLSAARIAYQGVFDKPEGTLLRVTASGSLRQRALALSQATLDLAGLQARVSDVSLAGHAWRARLDSNRFDLATVAPLLAALAHYALAGSAEAHLALAAGAPLPSANGTLALSDAALRVPGGKLPAISGANLTLKMDGNSATLAQSSFRLGSANVMLAAQAQSLDPPRISCTLSADRIRPAELVPARPADEHIDKLNLQGTARAEAGTVAVDATLNTPSGMVARVPYRDLALRASYANNAVTIDSLSMQAYGGALQATAQAGLTGTRPFQVSANLSKINIQQALEAQQSKAAGVIRGLLTGQAQISGRGQDSKQIEPTLSGKGQVQIDNGKLIGVNVVASALNKISGVPGIDTLFTPAIVARHPELFKNPDTDLTAAHLTFTMAGPRLTSHDITVAAPDYRMLGDGWFDLDRHLDVAVSLLMSKAFSSELRAQKKNVVFLMNSDGEIEIPLRVSGQLPKPSVQPNVQSLVERAATHALEKHGNKLLNKLGGFLGGGSNGGGNPLQRLFP